MALRRGGRRRGRGPGRHPGVQRQHSRCAQERDRLAVAAVRQQRAEGQADGRRGCCGRPLRRGVGARRDPQVLRHRRPARGRGFEAVGADDGRSTASIRARTPRWPRTCATSSESWPPKFRKAVPGKPPAGSAETRRRLCCYVTVTVRVELACRWPVVDLSLERDTPSGVMCDTPKGLSVKRLRPGNFKNVIQNIWYPFAMSDTRCSVPNTDRPPRFPSFQGSAGVQKSTGVGSPARGPRPRATGILRASGPLNFSETQYPISCQSQFAEEPYRR